MELDPQRVQLQEAFIKEVERINEEAFDRQEKARLELEWLEDERRASITVYRIRLARQIEQLERKGSGQEIIVGPIVNLPLDVLGDIFRFNVDEGMSPWSLAKVCRTWMNAALTTPHLWRYICIGLAKVKRTDVVVLGERQISRGKKQVCHTLPRLRAALQRSGAVPLEIDVECGGNDRRDIRQVFSLLLVLFTEPVSNRIGSLNLAAVHMPDATLPAGVRFGPFTQLTSMHLPRKFPPWTYELLWSVNSRSFKLETLHLDGPISSEMASYSFWRSLKILGLPSRSDIGDPGGPVGHFNDIAQKLVNLEDIATPWGFPDDHTPLSIWRNTRKITINCQARYLGLLKLPKLQDLTFYGDKRGPLRNLNEIPLLSFPELTTLSIRTDDARWFSKVSAPSLVHLTFWWNSYISPKGIHPFISSNLLSQVQSIKLRFLRDEHAIISTLERAFNVQKVEIEGGYQNQRFGLELLKRLDASQKPVFCPNLEVITLATLSSILVPKQTALPLIERVVSSRKEIKVPLKEFSVFWNEYGVLSFSYPPAQTRPTPPALNIKMLLDRASGA